MNRLALTFVLFTVFMDSIGFGVIMPVLPDLIMEVSGDDLTASARYGGWLMFVYAFMQFFFAPVLGNLSDAYGRRPILLLSMVVLAINYLLMGFADSLVLLFAGRILSGIGAATMSTCNAYIADMTSADERAQYFGLLGAAFGMGFVVGPVLGGFLGEYGPRVPFFFVTGLFCFNFVLGLLILPESLKAENRRPFEPSRANPFSTFRQLSKLHVVFGIMGVMFIYNIGHHVLPSIWSFYTIEKFQWSPREIGYSLGFIGILMVFVQGYLIRIIVPKVGVRWAGILGLSTNIIAFAGYAIAPSTWTMYVVMIPAALGALAGPALTTIASSQVNASQQGELQGGLSSMMSLTSIVSPLLMTQTFGLFSGADNIFYFPGAPFILAALLTMISLIMFVRVTSTLTIEQPAR